MRTSPSSKASSTSDISRTSLSILAGCAAASRRPARGDSDYGWHYVINGATDIREIAIASNADDYDNRIYYAAIMADDTIKCFWDESIDGKTFMDDSPTVTIAQSGLDMHWNDGYQDTYSWYAYLSYIGTDGNVHVLRHDVGEWEDAIIDAYDGVSDRTAISAYEDNVFCVFEYAETWGQGIKYWISYDAGDYWYYGFLTDTINDSGSFWLADATARGGAGPAAAFAHETGGEPDEVYLVRRSGYTYSPWEPKVQINDHDVTTGTWIAMNSLPHLSDHMPDVIETTSAWDGVEYVSAFGEPHTATYAQTFSVSDAEVIESFTVYINDRMNTDAVEFQMFFGVWDTANNWVSSLYSLGGLQTTTNNGGLDGYEAFTHEMVGYTLNPGVTYVFGVIASNFFDTEPGNSEVGYIDDPNTYPRGQFVFLNNGSDFSAIYDTPFSLYVDGDLAFEMTLRPNWSYGMIYLHDGVPYFDRTSGAAPCPWDISGAGGAPDDVVNLDDLLALLANWGPCPALPAQCPWDIAGGSYASDGAVNLDDLLALLANWGPCP